MSTPAVDFALPRHFRVGLIVGPAASSKLSLFGATDVAESNWPTDEPVYACFEHKEDRKLSAAEEGEHVSAVRELLEAVQISQSQYTRPFATLSQVCL